MINVVVALIFSVVVCSYGSILVPEYQSGSLYAGFGKEYATHYKNYEARPYAFEYGVSDPHTGDHKTQWEIKDKDGTVRGSYSLLEPDGTTRIVDYIADDHGFRAVVKKVGIHGTEVQTHGGGGGDVEHYHEQVHDEPSTNVLAPESPVIAYNSYDGGLEDYSNLKLVNDDIYTQQPLELHHQPQQLEPSQQAYLQNDKSFIISIPEQSHDYLDTAGGSYNLELPSSQYYPIPETHSIKTVPEYILPESLQNHYKVPEHSNEYVLTEPASKFATSYVQENRYKTPGAPGLIVIDSGKIDYPQKFGSESQLNLIYSHN